MASIRLCLIGGLIGAALCGPRLLHGQSGVQVSPSVSSFLDMDVTTSSAPATSVAGTLWRGILGTVTEPSALSQAMAEVFQMPRSLARFSFAVDNALEDLHEYRAFEYLAPQLYYAARTYRLDCLLFEF